MTTREVEGALWEHLATSHSFRALPDPTFSNRERLESLHNFDHFTHPAAHLLAPDPGESMNHNHNGK